MKAKPTDYPGRVLLELNRRDEPLMAAANGARKSPFKLKRILVPIDFSACSRNALRYAIPLAKEHQASIALLYVEPLNYVVGEYGGVEYCPNGTELHARAEKRLAQLVAEEIRGGIVTHAIVGEGAPELEIIDQAKRWPADLIVISTHGRTGLKHVFLGSVAEQVVRRAPCPVLVVRENEKESAPAEPKTAKSAMAGLRKVCPKGAGE